MADKSLPVWVPMGRQRTADIQDSGQQAKQWNNPTAAEKTDRKTLQHYHAAGKKSVNFRNVKVQKFKDSKASHVSCTAVKRSARVPYDQICCRQNYREIQKLFQKVKR